MAPCSSRQRWGLVGNRSTGSRSGRGPARPLRRQDPRQPRTLPPCASNQNALYEIGENERHKAEQDHIEERIRGVLTSTDIALDDCVRMAWTLGGILMPLLVEDAVFGGDDIDDIAAHVRALARETLMIETRTP
jgi:hypothetical protein